MIRVIFTVLLFGYLGMNSQITIIPWPSSEDIFSIDRKGDNILICGMESNLAKCYGNCENLIPVNLPTFSQSSRLFTINRPDSNYIYINYSAIPFVQQIWRSKNAGVSWKLVLDTNYNGLAPINLHFFDTLNGVAICRNFMMFSSNNGLETRNMGTWNNMYSSMKAVGYKDSTFIFGDLDGGAYITRDKGLTWSPTQNYNYPPFDFYFLNKDTVFSISTTNPTGYTACFSKSYNGGISWDCKPFTGGNYILPDDFFLSVHAQSYKEIYILARTGRTPNGYTGAGVILKSTDLGQTWTRFTTPFNANLNDIEFLNDSIALVCGNGGLLFKWNSRQSTFTTSIKETKADNALLKIYPNPTSDRFRIEIESIFENTVDVSIRSIDGRLLQNLKNHELEKEVDIQTLKRGIYLVEVRGKSFTSVTKLLKE